ncbi:MAG TPA: MBL fold metallo-hydrolase [Dehalococcoidia bacterium]|nr:MBL fold metallo-hydrolase [Dehalococcoidia bacterium]
MKIKWLGHASFLITAENGTKIITDPYGDYPGLSYAPIGETADIMLVSHDHGDHTGGKVKGNPKQVAGGGSKRISNTEFKGINTYHDTSKGSQRGKNTIFCFAVDGVRICHLGDLGHELSKSEVAEIGQVDVLIIPVGGFYTIDVATASAVCEQIKPRVIIPMHYKNDKCAFPIAGVEDFLKGKKNVKKSDSSEIELRAGQLQQATEIVVLKHAL